jgi:hypothetical protein
MTIAELVRRLYVTSVTKTDYTEAEVMDQVHDFGIVFTHHIKGSTQFNIGNLLECISLAAHSPGMALVFAANSTAMRLIGTMYANIYKISGYTDDLKDDYNRIVIGNQSPWKTIGDYYNGDIASWWDTSKIPQVMHHMREVGSMVGENVHVGRREDTYLSEVDPGIGAAWLVMVSKANYDMIEKLGAADGDSGIEDAQLDI